MADIIFNTKVRSGSDIGKFYKLQRLLLNSGGVFAGDTRFFMVKNWLAAFPCIILLPSDPFIP
jgi:hypothetical protein